MERKNKVSRAAEEAAMEHANVLNPAIGISMGDLAKVGLGVLTRLEDSVATLERFLGDAQAPRDDVAGES